MFSKSIFVFAVLAVAKLAVATPPACLLSALDTQETLNDYSTICGDNASDVQKSIQSVCSGANVQLALTAFSDTCKAKGLTVPTVTAVASSATPTGSKAATGAASATTPALSGTTGLTTVTATGATTKATGSSNGTATATGAVAESTGAAGRFEASLIGGLLAVGAGVFAAL